MTSSKGYTSKGRRSGFDLDQFGLTAAHRYSETSHLADGGSTCSVEPPVKRPKKSTSRTRNGVLARARDGHVLVLRCGSVRQSLCAVTRVRRWASYPRICAANLSG